MKTINKYLFLMLGFGAVTCFTACGSDSNSDSGFVAEPKEVALSQESMTLLLHEEEGNLKATPILEGYSANDIIWTNSNPSVATFDEATGTVTAKEVGKTTISARLRGRSAVTSCYVNISYVKASGITLDKYAINLPRTGTDVITATVSPDNACYKEVEWTSSDPSIAKVENGKVTANPNNDPLLGSGTVKITAATVDPNDPSKRFKAECIVNVGQFSGVTYPSYPDKQQW
jgi:uncharacterized protein YjdB